MRAEACLVSVTRVCLARNGSLHTRYVRRRTLPPALYKQVESGKCHFTLVCELQNAQCRLDRAAPVKLVQVPDKAILHHVAQLAQADKHKQVLRV